MDIPGKKLHDQVFDLIAPSVKSLLAQHAKRRHLHIVVMDPQVKPWEKPFEEAILAEYSFGDPAEWEHDYKGIALSKAKQAWRNQQPNLITQMLAPATLQSGDTFYWGSFEYYGMIVAGSGVESHFDMLVAGWYAIAYQQMTQHYIQKHRAAYPDQDYLP